MADDAGGAARVVVGRSRASGAATGWILATYNDADSAEKAMRAMQDGRKVLGVEVEASFAFGRLEGGGRRRR